MAIIDEYLSNIQSATYGEEVRQSIHDAIEAINDEAGTLAQERVDLAVESALSEVDAELSNLKSAFNLTEHTLFEYGENLTVQATVMEWKLLPSGLSAEDSNYKVTKFVVNEGDLLYLSLSKDGVSSVAQFQSSASAPISGTNTSIIGHPITNAVDAVVKVPTGATYLLVSQYKTNTTNIVAFARSDIYKVGIINKYGANTQIIEFQSRTYASVKMSRNIDGSFTCSGVASSDINLTMYSFSQEVGKTYHFKLNPNYNNNTSPYYFYVLGVNGSTSWDKRSEITWTATDTSTVSIKFYCKSGAFVSCSVLPIINRDYTNGELYSQISKNTTDIDVLNELSISGKFVLIDNNDFTWQSNGTVINYYSGEVSTGNPSAFAVSNYFDISNICNLIVHFSGYSRGNNGFVFFDENHRFINGIKPIYASDNSYDVNVQIPPNAKYCMVGKYQKSDFAIYMLVSEFAEQVNTAIELHNTLFAGGVRAGASEYAAYPMMPSNYLEYAENAYLLLYSIMEDKGYNAIPTFIITDSHGAVMSPFAWLNDKDDSIKCLQLGDIVNDAYNNYEIEQYRLWAKKINNICTVVGNHDALYSAEIMNNYTLTKAYVTTGRYLGGKLNYYFVDDNDYRVRYICLDPFKIDANGDSCSVEYDAEQLQWFADRLTDSPYDVVILTHCPLCDSAKDRSDTSIEISGPYPSNTSNVQSIMDLYQNKSTVSMEFDSISVTGDFSSVKHRILCALSGHTHREGTAVQSGVRHYISDAYLNGRAFASTFVVIDRETDTLRIIKFDNTQNFAEWDLPLVN